MPAFTHHRPAVPRYLVLAKVLRPHGVRGELSVQVITDFPERFRELEKIYLGTSADRPDRLRAYAIDSARPQKTTKQGGTWLLRLHGIDDRDAADLLREQYVFVAIDQAVPLAEDEVYLFQVIGLQAETPQGEALGRVVDIIETGANDVYVIRGSAYGEVLIPAVNGVVLAIEVEAGRMLVDPPPGLLPDQADRRNQPDPSSGGR
ncbi:MAG: ribosome maturation factor RimM [Aggregatilineales bacterium]